MARIRFHIDHAEWLRDDRAPVGIFGWCAALDEHQVTEIAAFLGDRLLATARPFPRDDVAAALDRPSARLSGFNLYLPFVELTDIVRLVARLDEGSSEELTVVRVGDLPGRGAVISNYAELRARGWGEPPTNTRAPNASPRFSILIPSYNTPLAFLRECVESVVGQTYADWEICAVDDCSPNRAAIAWLGEQAQRDPRIRVQRAAQRGGIARTANLALALATGDFVVPLDHDDLLLPHALLTLAQGIERTRSAANPCDALYSDEEKILENGNPLWPILKPAFSPEFFRGVMYVGHVACVRRALALELGGYDPEYDGIQDYDLFLRLSERTRKIEHVASILYQWRISATSSAHIGNIKGDMDSLQVRAVQAHLARIGHAASVRPLGAHRVRLDPPPGFICPAVTIFATRDVAASAGLQSLRGVKLIVLEDCGNDRPATAPRTFARDLVQRYPEAAGAADSLIAWIGEPVLEASERWIEHLAFLALAPEAGAVSPTLRSVENRILESGWTTCGRESVPMMRGFDTAVDGYNGSLACHREVWSASPTCWMISARATRAASGRLYDRVSAASWIRVARSWADEPTSRQLASDAGSVDPFFNPGFDARHADYRLAE